MSATHPSPSSLRAFGTGDLDDQSRAMVDQHLATCADCRQFVQSVRNDSLGRPKRDRTLAVAIAAFFGSLLVVSSLVGLVIAIFVLRAPVDKEPIVVQNMAEPVPPVAVDNERPVEKQIVIVRPVEKIAEPEVKIADEEPKIVKPRVKLVNPEPEIVNSIGMKLRWIPAGTYRMGGEGEDGPRHDVEISNGFYMSTYEVAQEEYRAVTRQSPSVYEGPKLPVENVSWNAAKKFCQLLSAKDGREYRLPTEAEWEYACRAGTKTPYSFGATISKEQANFNKTHESHLKYDAAMPTRPVGSFAANGFGLHDMHGNVWEWCEDWYDVNYYAESPLRDPTGPIAGTTKVMRGGSWYSPDFLCAASYRNCMNPGLARRITGIRVVMVP